MHNFFAAFFTTFQQKICNMSRTCLQVIHKFFTTCSWLVQDPLGLVHNFFTIFDNLFMTCLGLVHLRTSSSWLVHNLFKTSSWLVHELFTIYSWLLHVLYTTSSQFFQTLNMTCSGLVHNVFTNFYNLFRTYSGLAFSFSLLTKYSWA